MTTTRSIIQRALRQGGILAVGEETPADVESEALATLNGYIRQLVTSDLGTQLRPIQYGTEGMTNPYGIDYDFASDIDGYYVPENTRLMLNLSSPKSIALPPMPTDGCRFAVVDNVGNLSTNNLTVDPNGRKIDGVTSLVLSTDGLQKEWFYRDDIGEWVALTSLTDNDDVPFPEEFDELLILSLAMRINPRYGPSMTAEAVELLRRLRSAFRSRYNPKSQKESDVSRVPKANNRWHFFYGLPTYIFNRGR